MLYKRREGRWFRDAEREKERRQETEHFYGAGYVAHGLRERPLPRRYDERHYPHDYTRDHHKR